MFSLANDQAAGLRKLFSAVRAPATLLFAGGAAGRGRLAAGLARGLAAAGKEVLVIDEQGGAGGAAAAFGLRPRFDLLQAVNRDVPAAQVVLRAEPSIRLLPAARAARQYARLDAMERQALGEWLRRLQKGADFVLADAAVCADGSPLLPQPQRVALALAPDGPSITAAYALMKRLAQARDCRRFDVVVLRAATAAEGRTAFANLREVARRHLGAEIGLLGCLAARADPLAGGQALAEAFLERPRDAAQAGFSAARRVPRDAAVAYPVV